MYKLQRDLKCATPLKVLVNYFYSDLKQISTLKTNKCVLVGQPMFSGCFGSQKTFLMVITEMSQVLSLFIFFFHSHSAAASAHHHLAPENTQGNTNSLWESLVKCGCVNSNILDRPCSACTTNIDLTPPGLLW